MLILISALADDPVIDALRRLDPCTRVITNLCQVGVTLDIGGATAHSRILIEGDAVESDGLHAIVVSGMPCIASPGHSPEDTRYIQQETFGTWLALLRTARCRVLNRPSFEAMPFGFSPMYIRALSRRAGIPTIADEVCLGTEMLERHSHGFDTACLDLFTQSAFWLSAACTIDEQRMYSATDVTPETEQLVLSYVCGRARAHSLGRRSHPAQSSTEIAGSILDEAVAAAQALARMLKLDYAFFSFAVIRQRVVFSRIHEYLPVVGADRLAQWTAETLSAELAGA